MANQSTVFYTTRRRGAGRECTFFVPDNPSKHGPIVIGIALEQANDTYSTHPTQICTHFASLLSIICPELKPMLVDALEKLGITIKEVKLPSQADRYNVDWSSYGKLAPICIFVIFGCSVLLLLKHINPANYNNFMNKRIKAMKSIVGILGDKAMMNLYTFECGSVISSMLGSNMGLKKEVLRSVIHNLNSDQSYFGSICCYLKKILSWSGMYDLKTIHEKLIVPESSILRDSRIAKEVKNVNEAFDLINACEHPEFFRLTAERREQALLSRHRFPVLAVVAQMVQKTCECYFDVRSFDTGLVGEDKQLALSLFDDYKADIARNPVRTTDAYLELMRMAGIEKCRE